MAVLVPDWLLPLVNTCHGCLVSWPLPGPYPWLLPAMAVLAPAWLSPPGYYLPWLSWSLLGCHPRCTVLVEIILANKHYYSQIVEYRRLSMETISVEYYVILLVKRRPLMR